MNYHMNQKGFANIILVIIIVVLAGTVGYFTLKKSPSPTQEPSTIQSQTQDTPQLDNTEQTPPKKTTEIPKPVQNTQNNLKLTVLYPNGGERLYSDRSVEVSWSGVANKPVDIYTKLYQHPSLPVIISPVLLVGNVSSPQNKTVIPQWNTGYPVTEASYSLLVCPAGIAVNINASLSSSCDYSDSTFTLTNSLYEADKPAVISAVVGPSTLQVGETGTWTVNATDPEGQKIFYSMSVTKTYPAPSTQSKIAGIKPTELYSPKISWKFDQTGTYLLEFTASDFYGKNANASLSVNVQ